MHSISRWADRAAWAWLPRAKKKKVAGQEEAGPTRVEPDPAVLMPPPPPRPPKPAALQAPPIDPDLEARKLAGRTLQLAMKQHRAREREFARAEKRSAAAMVKYDAMLEPSSTACSARRQEMVMQS